jgi:hypothetical protein
MEFATIKRCPDPRMHKDIAPDSKRSLGSAFDRETNDLLRPLTFEEELQWMPTLLGVSANDPNFNQAVRNYYADMDIIVPYGTGLRLNVTTEKATVFITGHDDDGKEIPVKKEVIKPVSASDYIKYRYILKCIDKEWKVARSLAAAAGLRGFEFYLEDEAAIKREALGAQKARQEAFRVYVEMTYDGADEVNASKIHQVLELMYVHHNKNTHNMLLEDAVLLLEEMATKHPTEFSTIATDSKLEVRALVQQALNFSVLNKNGTAIFDGDEKMASDFDKMVQKLAVPEEKPYLDKLTARVQAATKEVNANKRKIVRK